MTRGNEGGEKEAMAGMGVRYLLDTCVLIDHLRGYPQAREWLRDVTRQSPALELAYSVISLAELFSGLSGASPENEEAVGRLVSTMKAVRVGEDIARRGGMYVQKWGASHGVKLPDALIAATAGYLGVPLVTRDERHFPMDDVRVVVPY
ncbi:MAG: type II toxin-antitoxin system VapC family toxin [Bacillota bacterium]